MKSIVTTLNSMYNFFNNNFIYVIEDNAAISSLLKEYLPYNIYSYNELTILENHS